MVRKVFGIEGVYREIGGGCRDGGILHESVGLRVEEIVWMQSAQLVGVLYLFQVVIPFITVKDAASQLQCL